MATRHKTVDKTHGKPFAVEKTGNVRVPIYQRQRLQGDRIYTQYVVAEYIDGKRKLRVFADLEDAKEKAKTIAGSIAKGSQGLGSWTAQERLRLVEAINLAHEAGFTTGNFVGACRLLRDACRIVGGQDQLLIACQFFSANKPAVKITPKLLPEAVDDFLERRRSKISERRARAEACYLGQFAREKTLACKPLHEITPLEISDFIDLKGWSAKTRNDSLGTLGLLYEDAMMRGWAAVNAAKSVKRENVKGGEIGIFTPAEAKTLLSSLSSALRPAIALWCFSGLRKEEIARLDWPEVNQGTASGAIYLPASKAKTGQARSIPISPNLRAWLERYRRPAGPVLPEQWDGRNLDSLTRHLSTASGVGWKDNAPRHSFATYSLARGDKPAEVIKAMGNSLRMLERHYWSRSATVTSEMAQEWFDVRPEDCAAADGEQDHRE